MYQVDPDARKPPQYQPTPAAPKPKRRGLRSVSKETAKLKRETKQPRVSYVEAIGYCQVCFVLEKKTATDRLCVHEIARGHARKAALKVRAAQLVACYDCNMGRLNDYRVLPPERQLAIKLLDDPDYFDLVAVNRLRGRSDGAITLAEVVNEVHDIFDQLY